jgi:hypothetical protein
MAENRIWSLAGNPDSGKRSADGVGRCEGRQRTKEDALPKIGDKSGHEDEKGKSTEDRQDKDSATQLREVGI